MKKQKIKKSNEKTYLSQETDKVGEIAVNYGFSVIKTPHITPDDFSKSKHFKEFDFYGDSLEKITLTRFYTEENMQSGPQPVMIHYKKPLRGNTQKKKQNEEIYGFEIMGSSKSTSEALLIKIAFAILSDMGYKDLFLDINSIGDRESISKFERELGSYFRKHSSEMPAKMRQDFKKNHYSFMADYSTESEDFKKSAPQTIGSLSEISRLFFKEVLEYAETFGVSYKIKPSLFSNKLFASHTVFEIRTMDKKGGDEGTLLARGYRYNYLAKKIGFKKDIPSVGLTLTVKKNPKFRKKVLIKKIKKPSFYLVQLGEVAKLKALNVVEMLRKNKIQVGHSITKDKIVGQLSGAEYIGATHVLIIGQKEAIENSIVVRNITTRAQDTVPIGELPEYLKKIAKK